MGFFVVYLVYNPVWKRSSSPSSHAAAAHPSRRPRIKAVIRPCCTCFAAAAPDPSATVTGTSLGNFRNTGTNVKVKGAPPESWRKEKWPVRLPHITRNNPQLIDSKHVSVFISRSGHVSHEGILPPHYTDHVIRRGESLEWSNLYLPWCQVPSEGIGTIRELNRTLIDAIKLNRVGFLG